MGKLKQFFREKVIAFSSSISGALGFLGGYQVCHNLCLGVITILSILGITVAGMPLLFLTKVAVPFWITAVVLFGVTLGVYFRMKCISRNLLLLNAGIIVAGFPFAALKPVLPLFWIVGGTMVVVSVLLMVKKSLL